jgi:predicted esterase
MLLLILATSIIGMSAAEAVRHGASGSFVQVFMQDEAIDGYSVWIPADYDASKTYPVILSIHSSGETGGTLMTALVHGPGPSLKDPDPRFDALRSTFIIVFPHLRQGSYTGRQWFDRTGTLDSILLEVFATFSCDLSRLYLLGYSTGGTGTWGYASSHPLDFAAIIPEAGFTRPDLGIDKPIIRDWSNLADVPVWAVYNLFDKAVSYSHLRDAVSAIESGGGKPFLKLAHRAIGPQFRESVIIDTDPALVLGVRRISSSFRIGIHSEGNVWANPVLYDWLLSHRNERYRGGILFRTLSLRDRRLMP